MSKKYTAPKPTGAEYVEATKKFNAYTTEVLLLLPEKWKDYLLDPVHRAADEIESLVLRANRVYINHTNMERPALAAAYAERIKLLGETLREFSVFDHKFEHMTTHIDLMHSEVRRLKAILKSLIVQYQRETKTPSSGAGCAQIATEPLTINIHQRMDEISYTTVLGSKRLKLGLTSKKRDYLLRLEANAKKEVEKRLSADTNILKKLAADKLELTQGSG